MKLLKQAEYMAATGFTLIRQTTFARGWVHIRHSRSRRSSADCVHDFCTRRRIEIGSRRLGEPRHRHVEPDRQDQLDNFTG